MTARLPLACVLVAALAALPVAARSQTTAPEEDSTGAAFFKDAILADAKTTSAIKKGLRSEAFFIDPASQYGDLTGDGKPDAAVRVDTGGAAGAIALYVFTAEGSKAGKLRIVYRNQSLYRVTAKITAAVLTVSQPVWAKGDEVCCPKKLRELDYVWAPAKKTLVRKGAARTVTVSAAPPATR